METWVAYDRGTPAGYVELTPGDDGVVEIEYFGLIPAFRGRLIGGHLLSYGAARAWDLAERWPGLATTKRVWLHTCSKDGAYAMDNYQRRGFRLFDTKVEEEADVATPGPWPGAFPPDLRRHVCFRPSGRALTARVTHDTLVSLHETRVSTFWIKLDQLQIAVPRFRHAWNWNCLGESAARRPRPHVQRHLSGPLRAPSSTSGFPAFTSLPRNDAHACLTYAHVVPCAMRAGQSRFHLSPKDVSHHGRHSAEARCRDPAPQGEPSPRRGPVGGRALHPAQRQRADQEGRRRSQRSDTY